MIPRMILMTLIRKDQSGNAKPSVFVSLLVFLIALLMLGIEIMGSTAIPK